MLVYIILALIVGSQQAHLSSLRYSVLLIMHRQPVLDAFSGYDKLTKSLAHLVLTAQIRLLT